MSMPKIIGLTGGIGSGKSKVALRFLALGIPCYIADDRAKDLMNISAHLKEAICKVFIILVYLFPETPSLSIIPID